MLSSLAFLLCLILIAPAFGLALLVRFVGAVAGCAGLGDVGRIMLSLLAFIGTPWKLALTAVSFISLFAAGCLEPTRAGALLAIGVLGCASLVQILTSMRPRRMDEFFILVPSGCATLATLVWSWVLFQTSVTAP